MNEISLKKATFINALTKYSNILLQIIFTGVLARILTPKDYGVVAIVFVFTAFFSILSDMGFGAVVIQDKTLSKSDIDSIFTVTFYLALILSGIFCGFSFFVAWFYNNDVYIPVCLLLSVSVFFNTLNMVPNAMLMKNKKFILVGIRTITVAIFAFVVTCFLAIKGFKYYALVVNSILVSFITFIWNYSSTRPIWVKKIKSEVIARNKGYGGFQFGFNFINYFSRNLDKILIGKRLGDISLSYYDKAYKLMLYPVQNLTFVISPVLHPILSDHQTDKEYIYNTYIRVVKILSLLGCFCGLFCFFAADELIYIAFGPQWQSSVPCFKILSFSIWFQIVSSSAGAIYLSIGNTRLMFKSAVFHVGITVVLTVIGVMSSDLKNATVFITISYILKFFIEYFFLIKKGFEKSFGKFLVNFIPELLVFIIMSFLLFHINSHVVYSVILNFIFKFSITIIGFVVLALLFGQKKWFLRRR